VLGFITLANENSQLKRDQFYPIHQILKVELYCTLNSDDPPMLGTNLNNDYHALAAQGSSWEELWQLNLNTLKAIFLIEAEIFPIILSDKHFRRPFGITVST